VPDEEGVKRPGARLTLLAHAPTAATTAAAFPVDEALDDRGRTWAREARGRVPRVDRVVTAPERACRETCEILGVPASVDAGIQGWDLGTWAGRTLEEISGRQPDDVAVWLADPRSAPHGGESLAGLIGRVRAWLGRASAGHTLAVCSPAVARAAVVVVLDAPEQAFWRLDVAPLPATDLRGGPPRWSVRTTGTSLGAEDR
jgi:broad specificity phosphatase PhoE